MAIAGIDRCNNGNEQSNAKNAQNQLQPPDVQDRPKDAIVGSYFLVVMVCVLLW